jgi:hypothetical protein
VQPFELTDDDVFETYGSVDDEYIDVYKDPSPPSSDDEGEEGAQRRNAHIRRLRELQPKEHGERHSLRTAIDKSRKKNRRRKKHGKGKGKGKEAERSAKNSGKDRGYLSMDLVWSEETENDPFFHVNENEEEEIDDSAMYSLLEGIVASARASNSVISFSDGGLSDSSTGYGSRGRGMRVQDIVKEMERNGYKFCKEPTNMRGDGNVYVYYRYEDTGMVLIVGDVDSNFVGYFCAPMASDAAIEAKMKRFRLRDKV